MDRAARCWWETEGVWVRGEFLDLPGRGADPLRKDLFIWNDFEHGFAPSQGTLAVVRRTFANAPLANPDGSTGVTLHVQLGRAVPESILGPDCVNDIAQQKYARDCYSLDEPAPGDPEILDDAHRVGSYTGYLDGPEAGGAGVPPTYRHLLSMKDRSWDIQDANGNVVLFRGAGQGFIKGQFAWVGYDAAADLKSIKNNKGLVTWDETDATDHMTAGVIVHELGHTLGLRHCGATDYPSSGMCPGDQSRRHTRA